MADTEQDTAEQQVHGVAIVLGAHGVGVTARWATGIVEQAVKAAKAVDRGLNGRLDLSLLGNVRDNELGVGAERLDHGRALVSIATGDHDLAAFSDKEFDCGLTNAARATGDQCRLARQTSAHIAFPLFAWSKV